MDRDDNKGMACSDELLTPRTRNAAFFLTNMGEENGDHPGPEKAFEPAGHSNPKVKAHRFPASSCNGHRWLQLPLLLPLPPSLPLPRFPLFTATAYAY